MVNKAKYMNYLYLGVNMFTLVYCVSLSALSEFSYINVIFRHCYYLSAPACKVTER